MRVQFNRDRDVMAQGEVVQRFRSGEIYELTAASARRWIRRGIATEIIGGPAEPPKEGVTGEPEKQSGTAEQGRARRKYTRKAPVTSTEKPSE